MKTVSKNLDMLPFFLVLQSEMIITILFANNCMYNKCLQCRLNDLKKIYNYLERISNITKFTLCQKSDSKMYQIIELLGPNIAILT